MVQKYGIYKCEICGNVVEVIDAKAPNISCCGQEMTLQQINSVEAEGKEKHVPVVTVEGNKVKVVVGSTPHPMEEKHYIGLIEILANDKVIASCHLNPNEKPEAEFVLKNTNGLTARAWCNLHGLWTS
jgi:superoxide reductase